MQFQGGSQSYTADEVVSNFEALLGQIDYNHELTLLGVSRMRFRLRRKMRTEWQAVFIGLWRLALDRSFPTDGDAMFEKFLERRTQNLSPKKAEAYIEKIRDYAKDMQEHGDTDFTPTGEYLITLIHSSRVSATALRLRVALHIRNLYTLIFDRLI